MRQLEETKNTYEVPIKTNIYIEKTMTLTTYLWKPATHSDKLITALFVVVWVVYCISFV